MSMKKQGQKESAPPDTFMIYLIMAPLVIGTVWFKYSEAIKEWFYQVGIFLMYTALVLLGLVFIYFILSLFFDGKKQSKGFSFGTSTTMISSNSSSLFVNLMMKLLIRLTSGIGSGSGRDGKKILGNKLNSILYKNSSKLSCAHPLINNTIQKYHQLVLGASGSGKTYSVLQPQVKHDIEQGKCVFIIDPKGDTLFSDAVYTYAKLCGREKDFRYFSISSPSISHQFNPFSSPSINETKDLIISATDWKEPYYKKMAEVALLHALDGMKEEDRYLSNLISLIPEKKEFTGLRADLEIMKISDYGKLIDGSDLPSLLDFYKENKICYFSLNTQAYPEASVQLGKIILGGIMGISNFAQTHIANDKDRQPTTVVVDEFGSFISEAFINFLNKARSANFRVILATQSVGDLEKDGDQTRKQIADNTTVKIVLNMSDPDSIEYVARLFGTQESIKTTNQIDERRFLAGRKTGTGSEREVQEFVIHPSKIRSLGRGEGFIMTQNPFSISKVIFQPLPVRLESFSDRSNESKNISHMAGLTEDQKQNANKKLNTNNNYQVKHY